MVEYSQSARPLQVDTPLGKDTLLVTGFRGSEQLSSLFSFQLSLIAENSTVIDFSKLIGHDITLSVATMGEAGDTDWRYLNGICARFAQGNRNEEFTSYYAEVVPKVWLLTRQFRSRIFQQKSVTDILKEVLKGFDCDFQLNGKYEPREYCVQYRETDFDFASRLMEEEGIFFEDLSGRVLHDDELARLLTFHNVLITSHQAFLTGEALAEIARTTVANITALARGQSFVEGSVLT